MNAFSYPSKRGINFAKIRGFKVTDYTGGQIPRTGPWNDGFIAAGAGRGRGMTVSLPRALDGAAE